MIEGTPQSHFNLPSSKNVTSVSKPYNCAARQAFDRHFFSENVRDHQSNYKALYRVPHWLQRISYRHLRMCWKGLSDFSRSSQRQITITRVHIISSISRFVVSLDFMRLVFLHGSPLPYWIATWFVSTSEESSWLTASRVAWADRCCNRIPFLLFRWFFFRLFCTVLPFLRRRILCLEVVTQARPPHEKFKYQ